MDMLYRKKEKKSVFAVTVALFLALSAGISAFAWFAKKKDYIPVDTYRGSVRTAYFNGGNGTAPAAETTPEDYKTQGSAYPSYENDDNGNSRTGPYQIDNAIQLYNFAWLQYLGYFNDEDGEQTYFVLTSDIDASGLVLPPVGNEEDPFLGNFNGNGYTISGLKISNDTTELNNEWSSGKFSIPRDALDNDGLKNDVEIVGLFGVIGDYSEDYTDSSSAPSVSDLTIEDVAIETVSTQALAGIAAGYVNGSLENITVAGTSTISSSADTALSYTDKLSDYALVGYCEEAYRRTLKVENVSVNEPIIENGSGRFGTVGQGEAWGNTIDMHDMFTRLKSEYDALNGQTSVSYASSKTITHNTDGTDTEVGGSTSQHAVTVTSGSTSYPVRMTAQSSVNDDSYAFIQRTNVEDFIYLYGDKLIDTVEVTTTEIWKYDSFYIKDQGTDNYLAVSSNAAANATTAETAGKWVFEQDTATGKYAIFTIDSNTKKYLTANNGNLGISTTAFSGWEVNAARTSISVNDHYLCWNSTDSEWELRSPPKNFICDTAEGNYLSLEKNGNTISFTNKTSASNATEWDIEPESGGYKISTVLDGARYYLYYDQVNNEFKPSADHHSVWYENKTETKNKLYVNAGGNGVHKALYYDSDEAEWKLTDYTGLNGNDWGGSISIKALNERIEYLAGLAPINTHGSYHRYYEDSDNQFTLFNYIIGDVYRLEAKTPVYNHSHDWQIDKNKTQKPVPLSILPITVNKTTENNDYSTSSKNTGYIIAGWANIKDTTVASGNPNYNKYAYGANTTIRTSQLGVAKIENSYNSQSPDTLTVYTNAGYQYSDGFSVINELNTPLKKYQNAKAKLIGTDKEEGMITGEKVHGLHFTGAAVSASNTVTKGTAKIYDINGEHTYYDYELPQSCIDFNLKETGYVNFFAGSYTASTSGDTQYPDSFCGLSIVQRNNAVPPAITKTILIKKIWENTNTATNETYPYVYEYVENNTTKYTTGNSAVDSLGYTKGSQLFDMQYLSEAPGTNYYKRLFYFEIPVNPGEYAMGSAVTSSGTVKNNGAYLIYLDIATSNNAEGDAKIKSEGTAITATASVSSGEVQTTETLTGSTSVIKTPPTYYPLLWDENDPTAVSANNKGYIISGANTVSNPPGDIRVSKYSRDTGDWNIKNSLVNGVLTDSIMYTIDSEGLKTIAQYDPKNFCKYVTSKAQMQALLSDTNVYGLHFMDASVDRDNILTVPTAKLDGETYTEYEMPRNCIDINIENRGYINFFAGTFFDNLDDSFFSLHRIERYTSSDNIPTGKKVNDIKDINEIRNIYQRTVNGSTEYLYQYEGDSAPDASQGWEKIFDLDWIRKQQDLDNIVRNAVYYFEIPIDPGEYALGSVDDGTGAYLLYLDVCTTKGDAVVTSEKMTVETGTYVVPAGVEFDEAALMVFEIPMSTTGDIMFTAEDESVTASHSLTATVSTADSVTETVTLYDYEGKVTACRVTAGQSVTYKYAVNDSPPEVSDAQTAGRYFINDILNNEDTILQYHYTLTGQNTVENSAQLEYTLVDHLDADGFTITNYNVTAKASDESVTATVDVFNRNKSYLRFFSTNNYQADAEVSIPVA